MTSKENKMTIDMLHAFQIETFLTVVRQGEGHIPYFLSEIELGYYMGQAYMEKTEGNIKTLQFVMANWPLFVKFEEDNNK